MKNDITKILTLGLLCMTLGTKLSAHCEIPCGIYDDELRINLILEHATTMEKSMKAIMELEKQETKNMNQLIRWVSNKEEHANKLQEIVTQYFMTQRIKFDAKDYDKKLAALHQMLIYSMKCKQTTDLTNISKIRESVETFKHLYLHKH